MLRALRYAIASWRFRRFTRPVDVAIRDARRRHKPTAHLLAAKTALVHASLAAAAQQQRDRTARIARSFDGETAHGA